MKQYMVTLLTVGFFVTVSASADTCPTPASSIDPNVTAKVSYNKSKKLYTYTYSIGNSKDAILAIDYFGLLTQKDAPTQSPSGWLNTFTNVPPQPASIDWVGGTKKSDIPKGAKSLSDIKSIAASVKPGKSLAGFSLESSFPPGVAQYRAKGYTQLPVVTPTEDDDEPEVNCPGWSSDDTPRYKTLVTGVTVGPIDPKITSVAIRLRDEKNEHHCEAINPNAAKGKIGVLVLSTKDFNAAQIDTATVRFGPAEAAPLSFKLVPAGGDSKAPWDEHEEWEKTESPFRPNSDEAKKAKRQDLILVFDLAALDIQCALDKGLFLRGKTQTGGEILGGVSSRLAGCDPHNPGRRLGHSKK